MFEHQVGGHGLGRVRDGFLAHGGDVLKPVFGDERGEREVELYEAVWGSGGAAAGRFAGLSAEAREALREFTPRYKGIVTVRHGGAGTPLEIDGDGGSGGDREGVPARYLRLADATAGLAAPCVADIKVGRSGTDPLASDAKRERARRKHPLQHSWGFRLVGAKVCRGPPPGGCETFGKDAVRRLRTPASAVELAFGGSPRGREAARAALAKLRRVADWFDSQDELLFYSSSLLVVFDGAASGAASQPPDPSVLMIDFGHVYNRSELERLLPAECRRIDTNYSWGLARTVEAIERWCDAGAPPAR